MKIKKNLLVSLIYELRETDSNGPVIEKVESDNPFQFIYGTGRLLQSFESALSDLSEGDDFRFTIKSKDAYGDRREDLIIDIPISAFEIDGKIDEEVCRVGNEIPMTDGSGRQFVGVINEISGDTVKMDFNHPMAGVDLYFSGKVIGVREPTAEELEHI